MLGGNLMSAICWTSWSTEFVDLLLEEIAEQINTWPVMLGGIPFQRAERNLYAFGF